MCVPLSDNITLDKASMMFVNPMTILAFFDVHKNLSNPSKKERAIINTAGASALGRMLIKIGNKKGIPVISVVRRQEQVDSLKADGAEYVVNSSDADFIESLKELAQKLNATVIFDAVGGKMVQQLLDAALEGSSIFIYGRLSDEACEINPGKMIFTGNQVQGFWLTGWLKSKNMLQSLRNTSKIKSLLNNELGTNIHKTFAPEQVIKAIETYKNNMSKGKVLLKF